MEKSTGKILLLAILALVTFAAQAAFCQQVKVDSRLPQYPAVRGVSGSIKSVGSDTMNNLMALWAEQFIKMYPNVSVEIEGKGSSTAPPALVAGAANFGPMSRAMKDKEIDQFEKRFGFKPSSVRAAIDMLAVYVHKDNPIARKGLSLKQLDAVFSQTRKGGAAKDISTWGQLGLTGDWANKPISLYGRNSASGTYGYFKKHALFGGDFKDSVKEQPGSASVVQGVASDRFGIGYSGIGYKTADVAVIPLAAKPDSEFVPATPKNVAQYPLARYMHIYLNCKPGSDMEPLREEFLKLIFSRQGQEAVIKDGFMPISSTIAQIDLSKLGITIALSRNAD